MEFVENLVESKEGILVRKCCYVCKNLTWHKIINVLFAFCSHHNKYIGNPNVKEKHCENFELNEHLKIFKI